MSFTKLDYCQYLLSSQVNYTLTNLAADAARRRGLLLGPHVVRR